jgi:antitoxin MazE
MQKTLLAQITKGFSFSTNTSRRQTLAGLLEVMYLYCRYRPGDTAMLTKVQKWGNSLALRIPKTFAHDAQLENDSTVEISLVDGQIIIKPVTKRRWTLDELLAGVTKKNLHTEIDTGAAVGKEVW